MPTYDSALRDGMNLQQPDLERRSIKSRVPVVQIRPRAPFLCHSQRTAAVGARSYVARRFGALFHVAMANATQCLQNRAVSLLQVHTHSS